MVAWKKSLRCTHEMKVNEAARQKVNNQGDVTRRCVLLFLSADLCFSRVILCLSIRTTHDRSAQLLFRLFSPNGSLVIPRSRRQ
jgi:hypothetical protein